MIDINYSINIMKQELENKYISPEILYAFKASIVALDKQTPKKTIERQFNDLDCGELYEEGYTFYCPECENEVGATSLTFKEVDWKTEYCCDCGKRLDWSDFE